MDDGHQNFGVAKDLSLVVVDAESGFGNGRVLPAGPLREPVRQGLARAGAVILVGDGTPDLGGYGGPALRARLSPADPALANTRIVAFAGIGRPEKFFDTLRAQGADLVARHAFADHHPYTHEELAGLRAKAASAGAVLVTTEKDFVRLNASDRSGILTLKVRATFDAPDALEQLLDRISLRPSS
jgi:tetraacyldisaccharide 4'-kinase